MKLLACIVIASAAVFLCTFIVWAGSAIYDRVLARAKREMGL